MVSDLRIEFVDKPISSWAYNLMSLFRFLVLQTKTQANLSTLGFKCFALGSWISKHAGKNTLKLSVSGQKRVWLQGLFSKVGDVSLPIFFLMHKMG